MPWYGLLHSAVPSLVRLELGLISEESKLEDAAANAQNKITVKDVDDSESVKIWLSGTNPYSLLTSETIKVRRKFKVREGLCMSAYDK